MCNYGGRVGHSKDPPVHHSFKRSRTRFGRDKPFGGAELDCSYHIRVKVAMLDTAKQIFKDRLTETNLKRFFFKRMMHRLVTNHETIDKVFIENL